MSSLNPRHTIGRILTEPVLLHGLAQYAALIEAEAMATDDAERGAIVGATAPSRRDKSRCRFSDPAA